MASDSVFKGIGRLIGTATELGAAVAGAIDKATAGGRELPPAPAGETPAAAIIRHGVSAAGNVARQVIEAAQSARAGAGKQAGAAEPGPASALAGPRVRAGAVLRVPLSVENPGREPMIGLAPAVAGWLLDGQETPAPGNVRFVPERLDIEPRDFEKLTVFVDVAPLAHPGTYRLDIALGEGARAAIAFTVAPGDGEASGAGAAGEP